MSLQTLYRLLHTYQTLVEVTRLKKIQLETYQALASELREGDPHIPELEIQCRQLDGLVQLHQALLKKARTELAPWLKELHARQDEEIPE